MSGRPPHTGYQTSEDEQPRSLPTRQNRKNVNPNFLFFCQIILLTIPIAILYAGLYFMKISSLAIVIICGVIIFSFLAIIIFIRPFSPTEQLKDDSSIPLTTKNQFFEEPTFKSKARRDPPNRHPRQTQMDDKDFCSPSNSSKQQDSDGQSYNCTESVDSDTGYPDVPASAAGRDRNQISNPKHINRPENRYGMCSDSPDMFQFQSPQRNTVACGFGVCQMCGSSLKNEGKRVQTSVFRSTTKSCDSDDENVDNRVDGLLSLIPDEDDLTLIHSQSPKHPKNTTTNCVKHSTKQCNKTETFEEHIKSPNDSSQDVKCREASGWRTLPQTKPSLYPFSGSQKPIVIKLIPTSSKEGVFEWSNDSKEVNEKMQIHSYNVQTMGISGQTTATVEENIQKITKFSQHTLPQTIDTTIRSNKELQTTNFTLDNQRVGNLNTKSSVFVVDEKAKFLTKNFCSELTSDGRINSLKPIIEEENNTSKYVQKVGYKVMPEADNGILNFVLRKPISDSSPRKQVPLVQNNNLFKERNSQDLLSVALEKADHEAGREPVVSTGFGRDSGIKATTDSSGESLKFDLRKLTLKQDNVDLEKKIKSKNDIKVHSSTKKEIILGEQWHEPRKSGLLVTESSKEEMHRKRSKEAERSPPRAKKKIKSRLFDLLSERCKSKEDRKIVNLLNEFPKSQGNLKSNPLLGETSGHKFGDGGRYQVPRREKHETNVGLEGRNVAVKKDGSPKTVDTNEKQLKPLRVTFPPFNLDFSSGTNDDEAKPFRPTAAKPSETNRKEPLRDLKKLRVQNKVTEELKKPKSQLLRKDNVNEQNKNKRLSHQVESKVFRKSSSSYENVIIERVIQQKKKTFKKFK